MLVTLRYLSLKGLTIHKHDYYSIQLIIHILKTFENLFYKILVKSQQVVSTFH